MEVYLGMIGLFPYTFAPQGWAFCNGQIMSIAQNTALFSLLGTTYGGNGQTTFGLPNLQGRVPIGWGQGPGLSAYNLGQVGGVETVTLTTAQIPAHTHSFALNAFSETGNTPSPAGASPANTGSLDQEYRSSGTPVTMAAQQTGVNANGNQFHENRPPYLAMSYCIALQGIYPSRN